MQSIQLLSELEQVPLRGEHGRYTYEDMVELSGLMRNDLFAIEISAGVEGALSSLLLDKQSVPDVDPDVVLDAVPEAIPDDLFEAYGLAFPDIADNYSLRDRYLEMVERGEGSVTGFISNIKGKLAELRIKEQLSQEFPDYFFEIAENPNQPVWDIFGTTIYDGTNVVLIQAKMGGEEYAGEVLTRMQENPTVLFAVSDEIQTAILADHPELASRFINRVNLSNAELTSEIEERLESLADQDQPVWTILATGPDGTTVPIQAKMGGEEYAGEALTRMQEDSDVLFTASSDIRTAVLSEHPDLSNQFVNLDISNYEFPSEVEEDLDLLVENSGIDVPDKVSGFLPYVTEIVIGIRLLYDIVKTERDFEAVEIEDKTRINAMKALVLFQRFGISAVLITAGGAVGSIVPGFGNILGTITGAGLSAYLSGKLRPHMLEIGMKLAGITADDLFYFRNKVAVDRIGDSLAHTAASMP